MVSGEAGILLVDVEQGHDRHVIELVAALEEGDLDDEEVADEGTSELLDEVARGRGGTTCCLDGQSSGGTTTGRVDGRGQTRQDSMGRTGGDDVVDNKDLLSRADDTLLHLEVIGTVLLHVLCRDTGPGQLALLADGDEAGAKGQGQRRAEEKAAGVEADDDIGGDDAGVGAEVLELELEGSQQGGVDLGVEEPGHNIEEVDAGDGEVGEAAEGVLEAYLCTGEFGGGGGGGGGLSSRGILGRGCGGQVALRIRG